MFLINNLKYQICFNIFCNVCKYLLYEFLLLINFLKKILLCDSLVLIPNNSFLLRLLQAWYLYVFSTFSMVFQKPYVCCVFFLSYKLSKRFIFIIAFYEIFINLRCFFNFFKKCLKVTSETLPIRTNYLLPNK